MQKLDISDKAITESPELISLTDLMTPLLQARWLVLIVTLIAIICAVSWDIYSAKYKSQGFFQLGGAIPLRMQTEKAKDKENDKNNDTDKDKKLDKNKEDLAPGIALSDFKRYVALYVTSERLNDYILEKKLGATPGVRELQEIFSKGGGAKIIEPVYPFTKLDAKDLVGPPKEGSNNVIGLRFDYESKFPETAQKMVTLLGQYTIDSIIYLVYSDMLRFKHDEIKTKLTELENLVINKKKQLEEYRRRAADLKQIITRYPSGANDGSRQIVAITEDSAQYLPPVTLLMTTEVQASEANEAILKAKHEQIQNLLYLEYYGRVKSLLDETKSGEAILRSLEPIKESVFKDKNLQDDAIKEVYNTITIDNQNAINLYLNKSRFIAGPTLPSRSTARPALAVAIGLMLGLFLSIVIVLGRNWWRSNYSQLFH